MIETISLKWNIIILISGGLLLLLTWFVYEKVIPKKWIGLLESMEDDFDDDDKPKKDKSKGRVCYSIEDENSWRDYL